MTTLPYHSPEASSPVATVSWTEGAVHELLDWVSQYPRKSDIRIQLPSDRRSSAMHRLQHTLIALGCTVTLTSVRS